MKICRLCKRPFESNEFIMHCHDCITTVVDGYRKIEAEKLEKERLEKKELEASREILDNNIYDLATEQLLEFRSTDASRNMYEQKMKVLRRKFYRRHHDIYLNNKFNDSCKHHIDKIHVLYIPEEIHCLNRHNLFTGKGMDNINQEVLEWYENNNVPYYISLRSK